MKTPYQRAVKATARKAKAKESQKIVEFSYRVRVGIRDWKAQRRLVQKLIVDPRMTKKEQRVMEGLDNLLYDVAEEYERITPNNSEELYI